MSKESRDLPKETAITREPAGALNLLMAANTGLNILTLFEGLQHHAGFAQLPQRALDALQEAEGHLRAAQHDIEDQAFACRLAGPLYASMRCIDIEEDDDEQDS